MDFLEELARNPKPLSSWEIPGLPEKRPDDTAVILTALRIPGVGPHEYFGRFLPDANKQPKNMENCRFKNTLICLLEPIKG
jgi:hypothetical protein